MSANLADVQSLSFRRHRLAYFPGSLRGRFLKRLSFYKYLLPERKVTANCTAVARKQKSSKTARDKLNSSCEMDSYLSRDILFTLLFYERIYYFTAIFLQVSGAKTESRFAVEI